MPAKIRSAGNLSQNLQEAVIATYICFSSNFTELELTNIQTNYWWGQMLCGPPNQNFGWATLQRPFGDTYLLKSYRMTVSAAASELRVEHYQTLTWHASP